MEYKRDVNIDKYNLDEELCRLPTIIQMYHEKLSEKIQEKDELKLQLEVLEAEIDKEIRDNADKKPTEGQIKNMVIMDKRRISKVREYNKNVEQVNILKGAVDSFDKKSTALTNLVKLLLNEYFEKDFRKNDKSKKFNKTQREGLKQ